MKRYSAYEREQELLQKQRTEGLTEEECYELEAVAGSQAEVNYFDSIEQEGMNMTYEQVIERLINVTHKTEQELVDEFYESHGQQLETIAEEITEEDITNWCQEVYHGKYQSDVRLKQGTEARWERCKEYIQQMFLSSRPYKMAFVHNWAIWNRKERDSNEPCKEVFQTA